MLSKPTDVIPDSAPDDAGLTRIAEKFKGSGIARNAWRTMQRKKLSNDMNAMHFALCGGVGCNGNDRLFL